MKNLKSKRYFILFGLIIVFLVLSILMYFLVYRTQSAWLADFERSLNIDRTQPKIELSQSINIFQADDLVVDYSFDYQVDVTGAEPFAKLVIVETNYLLETENTSTSDYILENNKTTTNDTYLLEKDTLSVTREKDGEVIANSNTKSSIETFWQIVDENTRGVSYKINNKTLNNIKLNRNKNKLSANIPSYNMSDFLDDKTYNEDISDSSLEIELDDTLKLKEFLLEYNQSSTDSPTKVIVKIQTNNSNNDASTNNTNTILLVLIIITLVALLVQIGYIIIQKYRKK